MMVKNKDEVLTEARFQAGRKSTVVSIAANIGLAVFQMVVGLFSASHALIADGVHTLSDLLSDFVVLFAAHHSRKKADDDHQYGHQRYENAASLALGAILVVVGAGMLFSAFHHIQQYVYGEETALVHTIALWVALAALCSKELLFRYMLYIAQRVRSGMLAANAWHARSDAASSLIAVVGIGGSLLGFPLLDPIAALIVGLMVLRMGGKFFWHSLNDLMDRAASEEESDSIRASLLATPGVLGIHQLRTRKMGDMTLVDVDLEVDGNLTVTQGHDIAVLARQRVLENHHVLDVMIHVDPVVVRVVR